MVAWLQRALTPVQNLPPQELEPLHYIVLADYQAVDASELSLHQSDRVEVLRVGSDGWWFVKHTHTGVSGWAPASYMELAKRNSTISSQSTASSTLSTVSTGSTGKVIAPFFFSTHLTMC